MEKTKKAAIAAVLILAIVVSFFYLAPKLSAPETYRGSMRTIDQNAETVLKLTAASTLASAGLSALPDDLGTPIADKLADFSEYFLLILCVLYAEKFLLTILGGAACRILIPVALGMLLAGLYFKPQLMRRMAFRTAVLGVALALVIPLSTHTSEIIYRTYQESIDSTVAAAEALGDEAASAGESEAAQSKTAGVFSAFSDKAAELKERAAGVLRHYVETLAVLLVTSCVIPILVALFFLWLIRRITGIDMAGALHREYGDWKQRGREDRPA